METGETGNVAITEFAGFNPNMYLFLVEDSIEHKKAKGVNKNAGATISHYKCKDALLNDKCLRDSVNRVQSKNHKLGNYEINKISLSCFDDEVYVLNNQYEELALGC